MLGNKYSLIYKKILRRIFRRNMFRKAPPRSNMWDNKSRPSCIYSPTHKSEYLNILEVNFELIIYPSHVAIRVRGRGLGLAVGAFTT